eukprot:CAMPEP_0172313528 /NCGR_PEP_ID=MMETSP1058-20130122/20363_1 /TAXON_ID=83371 /ORGANISM="Detonula confervacea, Strain CCMP 353" /LENGTH=646 /DNA_ID=CAMNT_0013027189 /DNA_START=237 /DNA_END=2177 /DNA_ORIENTATION=+
MNDANYSMDNGESTADDSPPSSLPPYPPSEAPLADEPSISFCQRHSPLHSLRFFKRRTIDHCHNFSLSELSGSLGDLGTFIPLTVALARERKIALAPALFWAGVSNFITGYLWDVPMCVQPMKSIAAVALTDVAAGTSGSSATGLDAQSVTTAGILTGGAVLILGATNLMEVVNWIVPLAVICGLQIGVGLRLASKGMRDIQKLSWGGGYDCIGVAIVCALLSMFWLRDNGNGMEKKERKGEEEGPSMKNSQTKKFHADGIEGRRVANSITASSDGEQCGMDDNMELGSLNNAHQLETTTPLQQPQSTVSTTPQTSIGSTSFSTLLAPPSSQSSQHPSCNKSSSSPSCFGKIWKSACCCLNPFPKTPHPVGIYLFLIGCLFAAITLATAGPDSGYDLPLHFFGAPVVINAIKDVTPLNWRQGFLQGTLPQLPLTTLNSVISVCCLAHTLYPEKRNASLVQKNRTDAVVTRREVAISVGLMNLILCPLGSMPNCHGAGGLAGQHRFGARHGTSVVVLGLFKIILAVFFGGSALTMLDALPVAVLGIMLVIAGLELVGTGVSMLFECVQKEKKNKMEACDTDQIAVISKAILRKNALVSMVTAAVIVALQKTHYGAIAGWVVHMVYGDGVQQFYGWVNKKRKKRGDEN